MKRIFILCLSLALLIACVPTPEQEYVVNKGDSTVEDKINAVPRTDDTTVAEEERTGAFDGNAMQRQLFPERWDMDLIPVADRFGIRAKAEVEM